MKIKVKPEWKEASARGLTPGKVYDVIGIEADYYRILTDDGEPVLYEPGFFLVVDASEPEEWVSTLGEEGERYAYPPELNTVGFFEDWHDGDEKARRIFSEYLRRRESEGKQRGDSD